MNGRGLVLLFSLVIGVREQLLAVEEDRAAGRIGCSVDELDSYLDGIQEEG